MTNGLIKKKHQSSRHVNNYNGNNEQMMTRSKYYPNMNVWIGFRLNRSKYYPNMDITVVNVCSKTVTFNWDVLTMDRSATVNHDH